MPRQTTPVRRVTVAKPLPSLAPAAAPAPPPALFVANPPTFGSALTQGFGFGAGSAIARNLFESKPAAPAAAAAAETPLKPCEREMMLLESCHKFQTRDGQLCNEELSRYIKCMKD